MKNKLKIVGVLSFGFCVALGLSPSNTAADEGDSFVDVNVLSKEDGKSSVLDVEILDLPIVGDVNVNIQSDPENDDLDALATVEVSDGVVDDLDVSLLEERDTKTSVATVELESSLTDDVTVDVLSDEQTANSFDGGVVEVNGEDLPLLGETHVGVLDKHVMADANGESYSSGLIQTDLKDGLLDDASIDILVTEKAEDKEKSAVVDVTIDDDEGILDDVGVSVWKREEVGSESKASLASVNLETAMTDDLNVDVASSDITANSFDGGLVEVNGEDLPLLGETHVGVLDKHVMANAKGKSDSSGLVQTDLNDGLLEDASIDVLATANAEDKKLAAVVDVSVDDERLLDGVGVSVLKREETDSESKTSLASVELETPVTNDVDVDVALSDSTVNSFDGGLVEVNGEDLPLLGRTHVGVLDNHVSVDENGESYSSGLIQTDLNDGLLEDASVGVLVRKMEMAEDGGSVTSSVVSLNLKLPGTDDISADVLTRKRQFEIAIDEAPSVTPPPSTGEETDDAVDENAPAPEEEDEMSTVPESTENPSSDGNEEEAMSNNDQEMVMPPASEGDSGDGFSGEEDGTMENNTGAGEGVEESNQKSPAGNGLSGNVDADSGYRTGEFNGTADASSLSETGQSNLMKGLAMNSADSESSLPKTGGFWDGKRLAFLALGLMAMGVILRKMGKSTWSAA